MMHPWQSGPVFDVQTRHSGQVAIRSDDRTVAKSNGYCRNLDIHLLHGQSATSELSDDPAEFVGSSFVVWPTDQFHQTGPRNLPRPFSAVAAFEACNNLAKNRRANADLSPFRALRLHARVDVPPFEQI